MPEFITPVPGYPISSPFGPRTGGYSGFHEGIDYGTPNGTPCKATAAGTVIFTGLSGAYGALIEINHAGGYQSRYGHMSQYDAKPNQTVKQGQIIGLTGGIKGTAMAGNATGPNLHFEIRHNGIAINPVTLLDKSTAPTSAQYGTVAQQQEFFNRVFPAYSHLVVDNIKGPKTEAVIREFQTRCHITVDGIVGPRTYSYMKKYGYDY